MLLELDFDFEAVFDDAECPSEGHSVSNDSKKLNFLKNPATLLEKICFTYSLQ